MIQPVVIVKILYYDGRTVEKACAVFDGGDVYAYARASAFATRDALTELLRQDGRAPMASESKHHADSSR